MARDDQGLTEAEVEEEAEGMSAVVLGLLYQELGAVEAEPEEERKGRSEQG